ncbi:HlyD family secretion protein [Burkholderia ubonensis]|uniref:Anibiotic ABC transporter n=1 Tax=Burkholderia ubonensis TaxID=101571 RepID=A0A102I5L2_9BURK|nr:HlyD family efflux transporter periplasmic adaptor subunit [Burkholderia ubonensis]AOI68798.1 anibiotic ABC transporter [Burkholderia ubonensis]KUZ18005.1 anibiotic ABC transporter [Burkholderia ubonensis]KUZ32318.1 anibiotic ABC transporter [Burkholderia ubonensis]KUZ38793.1 anibiotic ABC transporter [Burkholderia ubonensis]KUZ47968.1 anibiotic ABC transporter [Burkholderia ubonensis]
MSDDSLFRPEALDAGKGKLIGAVALYSPPYRWLLVTAVAMVTLAIAAFLVFGSYTKRERVMGQLVPTAGVLNVAPPVSGTVDSIEVREGQRVRAGDPLMTVSAEVAISSGGVREMVRAQLETQRTQLKSDLSGQSLLADEATRGLRERAATLESQLRELELQHTHRVRQVELARSQLEKLSMMRTQGYVSNSQVDQQEASVLDAEARLQESVRARLDVQGQLLQVRQQLREQPLSARQQRNEMGRKLAETEQAIVENEARRSVVLRAPADGVVGALLFKVGQIVNAGQTAVSVLPADGKLEAQLMVPSRAIGFIHPGQTVVLRYQAYPYQKFGQQYGQVTGISRSALSPQEVAALTGAPNVQEQHYRLTVALARQDIAVYDRTEHLRPGMALDADLLLDRRTLIEWVLEPIYALGRRASN